jgi:hypothetical protein
MRTEEVHVWLRWGSLRERNDLEVFGVEEMMILKCVRWILVGVAWTGLIGLRTGTIQLAGFCEHGKEPSNSIKYGESSCITDELLASHGPCSMLLISFGGGFTPRKGLPNVEI